MINLRTANVVEVHDDGDDANEVGPNDNTNVVDTAMDKMYSIMDLDVEVPYDDVAANTSIATTELDMPFAMEAYTNEPDTLDAIQEWLEVPSSQFACLEKIFAIASFDSSCCHFFSFASFNFYFPLFSIP